jgi:hypothetical protein
MSLEDVFEVRTGPVRVSGYAIKLRRVINGVLRKYYLDKGLDPKKINESVSQLNSKLFEVIVRRYKVPKDAVVNIQLRFSVKDNSIVTEDINVDVFDKDEILSGNITSDVKELLTG